MFVKKLKNYFELVNVANKKAYTFKKTFDNGCYAEIVLIGPLERRGVRFWYFAELNVYDEHGERNPECFRKGYASEAMSQLLKVADDVDERLELSAYPQDEVLSLKDLMDFYEDSLFKVRYGQEMYRDPLEEKKKRKKRKKAGSESSKESSLRDWFKRKGAKGSKGGWVDCNAPDGKGGYKSCGRSSGEKRKKYPSCRPTPGACKEKGRGKSWGKKGSKKKRSESMKLTNEDLKKIIKEELDAVLSEKEGKKDACYHKVKARYDVWPSAYASGALTKCRKVGAANWGNKSKKDESLHEAEITDDEKEELEDVTKQLKGAVKAHGKQAKTIEKAIKNEGKKNCGCGMSPCKTYGIQENIVNEEEMEEAKKKPCKPSKGKRFAKRVNGKCRSFGQKGQAKGGGDRIRPGTKKGDAYCARSAKIKKCKNPPCANDLSRKKWKCRGSKSMKEEKGE